MGRLWHPVRIILLIVGLINLVRGAAHLLLLDGGAAAAGMSLDHDGAADLIYVFGVSGAFEVLLAIGMIYVAFREPGLLVPALWGQIAKSSLVLLLGYALKPPVGVPPGAIPDWGTLIVAVVGLVLYQMQKEKVRATSDCSVLDDHDGAGGVRRPNRAE